MPDSEPISEAGHLRNREVYSSRVLENVLPLKGLLGEVKAECKYSQGLGACLDLGSMGGGLWSSQAEAGGAHSIRNTGVWVSSGGS